MAVLDIKNVTKAFGTTVRAVDDFSLTVGDGELVCLLGPSGSGKSTLLRMIGGFETATSGVISIDGQDVTRVTPDKRPTGMVFQSHALWTHMNVFGNIAFGLKLRRLPRAEIAQKVEAVLELVGLGGYGKRQPNQLSGGQQQRVALARSLVLEPKILLLDEPFASLDQHLRERLREEVRDIQQRVGITTLFVTHGQDEALALADRIVVLRDGRSEQIDPPHVVYRQPRTPFVAGFIGQMNLIVAGVTYDPNLDELFSAETGGGAYLNGTKLQVSNIADPQRVLIGAGTPVPGQVKSVPVETYHAALRRLMDVTSGMRRLGSAALSTAYVACGRLDGFFEDGLSPLDYGASMLIVREAGGLVTGFDGGPIPSTGGILVAGPAIHPWLVAGFSAASSPTGSSVVI